MVEVGFNLNFSDSKAQTIFNYRTSSASEIWIFVFQNPVLKPKLFASKSQCAVT